MGGRVRGSLPSRSGTAPVSSRPAKKRAATYIPEPGDLFVTAWDDYACVHECLEQQREFAWFFNSRCVCLDDYCGGPWKISPDWGCKLVWRP